MTNSVTSVYLITNIFGTYIIFRFMCIFFERSETDKKIEFISYLLYYFLIGLFFIAFSQPVINISSNLIMFFLLTFNYQSTLKTRLIATVSIYMILMTVETTVVLTLQYFNISMVSKDADIILIVGMIIIKIFSYIAMLLLSNFKIVKNNINVSILHWLSIFLIPTGTLISAIMMISKVNSGDITGIISIVILFVINVFVFFLYDELMKSYEEKIEKVLLQQQNNAYLKQLEIINQSQENLRAFRHDFKNHTLSLKALVGNEDNTAAVNYLNNVIDYIDFSEEYAKSGNSEIDSILNYKISHAYKLGIKSEINLKIPEKLNVSSFDLSVVLGNLLDNAIEAASKSKNEKQIKISVELERNVLYINISNSFDGNLNFRNGKLTTTHIDKENHGIGLSSVMKSIEKYNGTMDIHQVNNMFYVDVLIYNQPIIKV